MPSKKKNSKKKLIVLAPSKPKTTTKSSTQQKKLFSELSDSENQLLENLLENYDADHSSGSNQSKTSKLSKLVPEINLDNISIRNIIDSGKYLIENSDIRFFNGRCYGIVGVNGSGKSTLLHYIKEKKIPGISPLLNICEVAQETLCSAISILDYVSTCDLKIVVLLKAEEILCQLENPSEEQVRLLHKISDLLDGETKETMVKKAEKTLRKFGFSPESMDIPIEDLSGGLRMRVAIAGALHSDAHFLLLDEPTNHLDFETLKFLIQKTKSYRSHSLFSEEDKESFEKDEDVYGEKCVVVVSHDRDFLNEVCTDIVYLNNKKLTYFKGNFDTFMAAKKSQDSFQQTQYEKQQKMIADNENFIRKFKAKSATAGAAQSRMKMLDKLERIDEVAIEKSLSFKFDDNKGLYSLSNPVLCKFENAFFDYDPKCPIKNALLRNLNFKVEIGDKIGLLGFNGCGKSTLIKMIEGKLTSIDGIASVNNSMRVGYFSQHSTEALDPNLIPFDFLKKQYPDSADSEIYQKLGRFGLTSEKYAGKKINDLSGGMKARINFCMATWEAPHLLLLDEPTNHLDFLTIDSLVKGLETFPGAVFIVSHDKYFLQSTCKEFLSVGTNGIVTSHSSIEEARKKAYVLRDKLKLKKLDKKPAPKKIEKKLENIKISEFDKKDDDLILQFVERAIEKKQEPKLLMRFLKKRVASGKNERIVNSLLFYVLLKWYDEKKAKQVLEDWKEIMAIVVPKGSKVMKNAGEIVDKVGKNAEDRKLIKEVFGLN